MIVVSQAVSETKLNFKYEVDRHLKINTTIPPICGRRLEKNDLGVDGKDKFNFRTLEWASKQPLLVVEHGKRRNPPSSNTVHNWAAQS
jgi:hypothetical protein